LLVFTALKKILDFVEFIALRRLYIKMKAIPARCRIVQCDASVDGPVRSAELRGFADGRA